MEIDVFWQRNRKPVGEILLGLLTQSLRGAELRAPPIVNRRPVEFRVFRNLVFLKFLQQLGKPGSPGLRKWHGVDASDFDSDLAVRQVVDVQRYDEVLEFFLFGYAL